MTNEQTKQKSHPYSQVLQWVAEGKEIECHQAFNSEWRPTDYDTVLSCAIHGVKSDLYLQPQDFRLKPQRHVHQDLIDAKNTGARIQYYAHEYNEWLDCINNDPMWNENTKYRIKPKDDATRYAYIVSQENGSIDISHWTKTPTYIDNLKVVFDGETNKIKSIELLEPQKMTELLPPSNPVIRAWTYTVYHSTSQACLTTVLAVCQYVAKETLKDHYKRLQSDPSDSGEYSFVYENVSDVVLQNNQILVLDVQANEVQEELKEGEICGTLQPETTELTGETNEI